MKEKIWIHIPKVYQNQINYNWSTYYCYDTEDKIIGKMVAYSFYSNTQEYNELTNYLKDRDISYIIFRREYEFKKAEIENAEILELTIWGRAKNSYSPDHDNIIICSSCGETIPLLHYYDLHVDSKIIRECNIAATYSIAGEYIVSEKLKNILLKENVTGVNFLPIYQLGTHKQVIEGYYQLIIKEGIGPVTEPSIVEKDNSNCCLKCGFYKKYLCKTLLYFKRHSWSELDICFTKDWFGSPPKLQGKNIIISQRLYKILQKHKIKEYSVRPAYFVD